MKLKKILSLTCMAALTIIVKGQSLDNIGIVKDQGARVIQFILDDSTIVHLASGRPLFSFRINNRYFESDDVPAGLTGSRFVMIYPGGVEAEFIPRGGSHPGWMADLVLKNIWTDTVVVSDVVPFAENTGNVYLTASGPADLARAKLFIPGKTPVRVILPDNAWEMGFSSFNTDARYSVAAIARRTSVNNAVKKRYETVLPPDATVTYSIYGDIYEGKWQDGLRLMFRDRYLYDLYSFDDQLYKREDLRWIRKSYLIILQMAWDRQFHDRFSDSGGFTDFLTSYNKALGKIDVFGIWPTWPRLGLDERNQWDLFRDLPGGLNSLRNISRIAKSGDTRFFIEYNPWDNSTRQQDHLKGMADIIAATEADGVVLDTRGSSTKELQMTADSVRSGVVMFSEGMAVVKDMPGIISGRVHNALFLSPELNLNKFIRPDFAIFRVCDVGEDVLHREISVAFFNGYGTELNLFRPGGRGDEYAEDLSYLAKTTFILRQNNDVFTGEDCTPLVSTLVDRAYVNMWKSGDKTIYTVLNMDHRGLDTALFEINISDRQHLVSLWNHEELDPVMIKEKSYAPARASSWNSRLNATRRESSVDCIALLPSLIRAELKGNILYLASQAEGTLSVWKEKTSHAGQPFTFASPLDTVVSVDSLFGIMEGRIIIQLEENGLLKDERVLRLTGGRPWLASIVTRTAPAQEIPDGMVLVPSARFRYRLSSIDEFIPYPATGMDIVAGADSFLIDRYPVTNEEYLKFVREAHYVPSDTTNYLRHWEGGIPVTGQERYPVVFVSLEDARAYARWAGKRLPTEAEWQLAAQGTDGRKWPWGNEFHATKCNNAFGRPTPVDAFPKGESPYGVADLVGNVWQMTNDVYCNGAYYFNIIRGGSYFRPASGSWYIQGGPQQLDMTQMQLLVSPGFDRSSTVGFRCVKDVR